MQPCRTACILGIEGVKAFSPAFFTAYIPGRGQEDRQFYCLYRNSVYTTRLVPDSGFQMRVHEGETRYPMGAVIRSNQPEMMNFL